jgi:hypothetical protein
MMNACFRVGKDMSNSLVNKIFTLFFSKNRLKQFIYTIKTV